MTFDRAFWSPVRLDPMPTLEALREAVFLHSQRRAPKWRFRFAADLFVQLQPKACPILSDKAKTYGHRQHTLEFEGRAVFAPTTRAHQLFTIYVEDDQPGVWWLKTRRVVGFARYREERDYLLGLLIEPTFANIRNLMVAPQCLLCGKALTDPASRARCIGPECASTTSIVIPGIFAPSVALPTAALLDAPDVPALAAHCEVEG